MLVLSLTRHKEGMAKLLSFKVLAVWLGDLQLRKVQFIYGRYEKLGLIWIFRARQIFFTNRRITGEEIACQLHKNFVGKIKQ